MLEPTQPESTAETEMRTLAEQSIQQIFKEYFIDCVTRAGEMQGNTIIDDVQRFEVFSRPARVQLLFADAEVNTVVELLRKIAEVNNEGRLFIGRLQQWETDHSTKH
jgi:hypothetical protein